MIDKDKIKAVAFDFGGTLDSPFLHWIFFFIHLFLFLVSVIFTCLLSTFLFQKDKRS